MRQHQLPVAGGLVPASFCRKRQAAGDIFRGQTADGIAKLKEQLRDRLRVCRTCRTQLCETCEWRFDNKANLETRINRLEYPELYQFDDADLPF